MCGIVGIVNKDKSQAQDAQLHDALQSIAHRGPDAQSIYTHNQVALGNVRLAIIDIDDRSNMPMQYKHLVITYNGEVYNYREIRDELIIEGYTFETNSDTEVVLKAYHLWGPTCLQKFNGMWAFALLDKEKNELFCCRDRFGIKPFYYTVINNAFCFSSEIKAFTKIEGWTAQLNTQTAYNYLVYGMQDYGQETLFSNVFHLPPSHHLIYDLEKEDFTLSSYYTLENQKLSLSFEEASKKFQELFDSSLRLRFRSDVKVGSCLSGGLDSSAIVAYSKDHILHDSPFETVSATYPNKEIDESSFIQDLVEQKEITNHRFSPDLDEVMDNLKSLVWTLDEPFSSASIFAQHRVFQRAGELGLKVMLDGQGGDEILAGYDAFYLSHIKSLLSEQPLQAILELIHFAKSYKDSYINALKAYQASKRKSKLEKPAWIQLKPPSQKPPSADRTNVFSTSKSLLFSMGIQALLHYEDRNSMAHSVESRLPFLDYRLVEFCVSLPSEFKIHKGRRKHILRETLKEVLPSSIYNRLDKKGFETPQEKWMVENRDKLTNRIRTLTKVHPYIDVDELPDNYRVIWRTLVFLEWCAVFKIKST